MVAARFVDRVGKGIRGAPRDALVADLAPARLRGAAYGLRQSLDTVGAFARTAPRDRADAGCSRDIRTVLWVAVIPAALAVLVLVVAVREPERAAHERTRAPIRVADAAPPGGRATGSWSRCGAVLTLARFSEAFLMLRAADARGSRSRGCPRCWW